MLQQRLRFLICILSASSPSCLTQQQYSSRRRSYGKQFYRPCTMLRRPSSNRKRSMLRRRCRSESVGKLELRL